MDIKKASHQARFRVMTNLIRSQDEPISSGKKTRKIKTLIFACSQQRSKNHAFSFFVS